MGRRIYEIRNNKKLPGYSDFSRYYIENFGGTHFCDQHGPAWKIGTEIIILKYYYGNAGDTIVITFPTKWLRTNWEQLEINRMAIEIAQKKFDEYVIKTKNIREKTEQEYQQFLKLKAQFKDRMD
jgi:hypothetical protein